jgi:hypothetical protein
MANLPETSNFDSGVYEIQTTDLVLGGISGAANAGALNLTNRSRWLFDQNTATQGALTALNGDVSTIDGQISSLNASVTSIDTNLSAINGQLPLLAPIANPSFTGAPRAPTAGGGTNSTQIATTAFVASAVAPLAPINSPVFTGSPNAPTPPIGDSTVLIATTAFVNRGSSLNQNGYRKNPDGTITQWGYANPNGGTITVAFNVSFTSAVYSVVGTSTSTPTQCNVPSANTSNFQLFNTGGHSYWQAEGE